MSEDIFNTKTDQTNARGLKLDLPVAPNPDHTGNVPNPSFGSMDSNLITQRLNFMLYGAPPSEEVTATDAWDYAWVNDPAANVPRLFRKGEGIRVHKNHVTLRHNEYEWIPDERAIGELKALMAAWREAGMGDLADTVETREESDGEESSEVSIYDSLGKSKTTPRYFKVPLAEVKFYKEKPYNPNGLAEMIKEPRSFARITGLGT